MPKEFADSVQHLHLNIAVPVRTSRAGEDRFQVGALRGSRSGGRRRVRCGGSRAAGGRRHGRPSITVSKNSSVGDAARARRLHEHTSRSQQRDPQAGERGVGAQRPLDLRLPRCERRRIEHDDVEPIGVARARRSSAASTSNASPTVVRIAHSRTSRRRRLWAMLRSAAASAGADWSTRCTERAPPAAAAEREPAGAGEHVEHVAARQPCHAPACGCRAGRGSARSSGRARRRPPSIEPALAEQHRPAPAARPTSVSPSARPNVSPAATDAPEPQHDPLRREQVDQRVDDRRQVRKPGRGCRA